MSPPKSPSSKLEFNRFVGFLLFALGFSLGLVVDSDCGVKRISLCSSVSRLVPLFSSNINGGGYQQLPPPSFSTDSPPPLDLNHNLSDEELFSRASSSRLLPSKNSSSTSNEDRVSKVAFMFLVKGPLPLAPLWEKFFQGREGRLYSIYIHAPPSYNQTNFPSSTSPFYGRYIPSQEVQWGTLSMIEAEKRLLANAILNDPSNQRFILLSESCIPLYNFTTIHNYLMNSPLIYLDSNYNDSPSNLGRYRTTMSPDITPSQWRKGSQWFVINRHLALIIVSDHKYYNIFKRDCHVPTCINDEHYFPTLTNIVSPWVTANRSVTWTDWSRSGSHPRRYVGTDINDELVKRMRYERNCSYNGEITNVCYLFARKFADSTLRPLLNLAPNVLGF